MYEEHFKRQRTSESGSVSKTASSEEQPTSVGIEENSTEEKEKDSSARRFDRCGLGACIVCVNQSAVK